MTPHDITVAVEVAPTERMRTTVTMHEMQGFHIRKTETAQAAMARYVCRKMPEREA